MKLNKFKQLLKEEKIQFAKNGSYIYKSNYYKLKVCENCRKMFMGQGINIYCSKSCAQLGENNGMYNSELTEDHREKGRATQSYYLWKVAVYNRDDRSCQYCGSKENICSHHIESYTGFPELRTEIQNGITWCKECHGEFHHLYGYETSKDEFDEYMETSPIKNIKRKQPSIFDFDK